MYGDVFPNRRWGQHETVWQPPTDVYEFDDTAVVIVEIAGLQAGDFQVSWAGRTLEVTGIRRQPAAKLAYQQMEIHYGRFRTQVQLPWALEQQAEQEASYDEGFLRITLRRARAHRVPVRAAGD